MSSYVIAPSYPSIPPSTLVLMINGLGKGIKGGQPYRARVFFSSHRGMLIDGQKWACEACIRGHRVTSCKHHGMSLFFNSNADGPFLPVQTNSDYRSTVDSHQAQRPPLRHLHHLQLHSLLSTNGTHTSQTRGRAQISIFKSNAYTYTQRIQISPPAGRSSAQGKKQEEMQTAWC